jgi:hypothetical protein
MPVTIGRREVIAALGGAAAWPLTARGRNNRHYRWSASSMPDHPMCPLAAASNPTYAAVSLFQ